MNPNQALWEKGDFTKLAALMRQSGEAVVESLAIRPPLRALDLGCGDGTGRAAAGYCGNYVRLAAEKKRHDPGNLFRVSQNILPATEDGMGDPVADSRWLGEPSAPEAQPASESYGGPPPLARHRSTSPPKEPAGVWKGRISLERGKNLVWRVFALLAAQMMLPAAANAIALFELPASSLQLNFSSVARAGGILDPTLLSEWSWSSPSAGAFIPGAVYQRTHSGGGPGTQIEFTYDTSFGAFGEYDRLGARSSMRQVGFNGEQSATRASTYAAASDAFLVESATLAPGTPVTVNLNVAVSGVIQGEVPEDGGNYATAQLAVMRLVRVYRGTLGNLVFAASPQDSWDTRDNQVITVNQLLPWALAVQVGDAVSFRIALVADSMSTYNGGIYGSDPEISASVDAMNTLGTTIAPNDGANVQLRFVSGHDYSPAAIPEPQTWALWLCGLVSIGWLALQRRVA